MFQHKYFFLQITCMFLTNQVMSQRNMIQIKNNSLNLKLNINMMASIVDFILDMIYYLFEF